MSWNQNFLTVCHIILDERCFPHLFLQELIQSKIQEPVTQHNQRYIHMFRASIEFFHHQDYYNNENIQLGPSDHGLDNSFLGTNSLAGPYTCRLGYTIPYIFIGRFRLRY